MKSALIALLAAGAIVVTAADDSTRVLTIDHYVKVVSTVPAIAGQPAEIYVRERAKAGTVFRAQGIGDRTVLFVHGAGTPGAVAFDPPRRDVSWMEYLADAGFDVFAMDFSGYGRSTRPHVMNDPCNLSAEQQTAVGVKPCPSTYKKQLTTIQSDWDDLSAVVDYIRALRRVERVSLIAWSLGGPRSGGFAARHPAKVNKLVLLAPAYNRTSPLTQPDTAREAVAFNKQSREDFFANWERQVGCADQYDRDTADAVWSAMLESDPVGATWGSGVRRAPSTATWGWNAAVVGKMQTPTLIVAGIHDKQVVPDRVRELFTDLGAKEKMLIDLGCSSHNAMWEKNRTLLFKASLDWLTSGSVNGAKEGVMKLGY